MQIEIIEAASQEELTYLGKILDDVFEATAPAVMIRVGFMMDFQRSQQCLLLAKCGETPVGAIVALRGKYHIELTHMAVSRDFQGKGIGKALFTALTTWVQTESFSQIQWSVSPNNTGAVAAYLAYGGHIVDWIDNAYGLASDSYNSGETDRFRGRWEIANSEVTATGSVAINDHSKLRELLHSGHRLIGKIGEHYHVARAISAPQSDAHR